MKWYISLKKHTKTQNCKTCKEALQTIKVGESYSRTHSYRRRWTEVSGQLHASVALLHPEWTPGTYTTDRVGPWAGLDGFFE